MDFGKFCRELMLSECEAETVFIGFGRSVREFPGAENMEVISEEYLREILPWTKLDPEDSAKLLAFASGIRSNRTAALLFFHAFQTLFSGNAPRPLIDWPDFSGIFGTEWSLFYLLLSCSVFAPTRESYRRRGIPQENLIRIGAKIASGNWLSHQAFGVPGYARHTIYWLRGYPDLKVLPVERFEFRHSPASVYNVVIFRRRRDGGILALFGRNPCGFLPDGSCCAADDPGAVTFGGLIETADEIIGNAVDPATGRRIGTVKLSRREWETVISPADPVLEWHIPGGGGMTPEISRHSLEAGFRFFDRYFPELPPPRAIMCSSWAFWHRYEELRPEANPALIMRECYEFDRPHRGFCGFYCLFGAKTPDDLPHPPPRDNSLRRTMLDILEQDKFLGDGGIFILRDDLDRWGSAPYRNERRIKEIDHYLISG